MSTVNVDLYALWQRDRFVTSLTNPATPSLPAIVAGDTWNISLFFVDDTSPMQIHRFATDPVSVRIRAAGNNHGYADAAASAEIVPSVTPGVTRAQAGGNFVVEKQDVVFDANGGTFTLTFNLPTSLSLPNGQESYYYEAATTAPIDAGASATDIAAAINAALRWHTYTTHTTGGPFTSTQIPASAKILVTNWTQYRGFRIEFGTLNSGSLNNYVYALSLASIDGTALTFKYGWVISLPFTASDFSDYLVPANGPSFFEIMLNGGQAAYKQLTADPAGGGAPVFTNGPPPNSASIGSPYSFSYFATGFPAPTFSVTSGSLPSGLSLSSGGVLSGTPTTAGIFSGVVTATNTAGTATQAFSITTSGAGGGSPGPGLVAGLASYRNGNFNVLDFSDGPYLEDRSDEWPGLLIWHLPYCIDIDQYQSTKPAVGSYEGPWGFFWKDTQLKYIGDGIVEFERLRHNLPGDADRPISVSKNYQLNDSTYQGSHLVDPEIISFSRDIAANCNYHYALGSPGGLPVVPIIQNVPFLLQHVLWDIGTGFPTHTLSGVGTIYDNNFGVSALPGSGIDHVLGNLYCRKILTG